MTEYDLLGERPGMIMDALIGGENNEYRYVLRRIWDAGKPMLVVCMVNPSFADDQVNDPTILALIWFATQWGYGGLYVVNLYAFRASQPSVMRAAADPVGPDNRKHLAIAIGYAKGHGGKVLVAWGNNGDGPEANAFIQMMLDQAILPICLGWTNSGNPKHPMARGLHRIPRDQQPLEWIPL